MCAQGEVSDVEVCLAVLPVWASSPMCSAMMEAAFSFSGCSTFSIHILAPHQAHHSTAFRENSVYGLHAPVAVAAAGAWWQ